MTDTQKSLLYRCLFISVLLLIVFGNTLSHRFVWDDFNIIVESPLTEKLSNIPKLFLSEDTADGAPTGYYRPVTYVSFALDRAVWGLNPVGFNITNLLLHILVALTFFRVVTRLFRNEKLALIAALIFSLHPLTVETVNFHAGGRNTLICALFALLSLLFYLKKSYAPSVACFAVAIFSKEFALLLPAIFFLYDTRISKEKIRWWVYAPYVVSALAYLGARSFIVRSGGNLLKSANFGDAFWIAPRIIIAYLKNMIFPFGLKTLYVLDNVVTWPSFLANVALLLALLFAAFYFRKKNEILLAICMYLLFLLPVTNIFNLGSAMMADRYAYFALFGFSLAAAYLISTAKKQTAIAVTAVLCLLFAGVDIVRNNVWQDEISLFSQMIKDAPDRCVGFQNLGVAYYLKQDLPNADKYLTLSYGKKGLSGTMLVGSASMFLEMNKPDKAIAVLNQKINFEPDNPQPYIMLSRIYEQLGNQALATSYRDKAVALAPGIIEMMKQRTFSACRQGEALMSKGNNVKAELMFKEALAIDPFFVPALIDMGSLCGDKGELRKSLQYFTRAAALDPQNPAAHHNLSMVYESMGSMAQAQAEMARYRELDAVSRQKGTQGAKQL